jgi:hypothetical protein
MGNVQMDFPTTTVWAIDADGGAASMTFSE